MDDGSAAQTGYVLKVKPDLLTAVLCGGGTGMKDFET
jgi:hypothetical protein